MMSWLDWSQQVGERYVTPYNWNERPDYTETVLAKKHHRISVWFVMLYLMGLNMSNNQIAAELDLNPDVAQTTTMTLRREICARKPGYRLKSVVECDEAYVRRRGKALLPSLVGILFATAA